METLDTQQLHALRLSILENAEALHREATLLLENGMHSRAYLLAHFCIEELGKIPIIVGVLGKQATGDSVDWKKVRKRFCSHTSKIESQNGHFYTFGLDVDLIQDSDLKWLRAANAAVTESYQKKNISTYVDVVNGKTVSPLLAIGEQDAKSLVEFAFSCLSAHHRSERLTNPILYNAESNIHPNANA